MPRSIVTSPELVSDKASELSELEYGLFLAHNAFGRWTVRCMAAAGLSDLSQLDVVLLHTVNRHDRPKKLADLCFFLNIEDTHLVTYALKKLSRMELVEGRKQGKEVFYFTTEQGQEACAKYREVREACLIQAFEIMGGGGTAELKQQIGEAADLLRALSGLYDQAARSATAI